jgi:hypothetical protein
MFADTSVDLQTFPIAEWLAGGETAQIPWKVQIGKPELRTDQRYEIGYYGSIETKDLEWPGDSEELLYVSGVSSPDGDWIIPPKAGRQIFESKSSADPRILFGDCMFVRPGDYTISVVVYDSHSGKHSVTKRHIRQPDFSDEPLPQLSNTLPPALFPTANGPDPKAPEATPGPLFLAVANKRPVAVQLISVVSPPDAWSARPDFIRWTNNRLLAAMSVFSQMKLENGSISALSLDLVNQTTRFEQRDLQELDWSGLADTLPKLADASKVTLTALETRKGRAVFFRNVLSERLAEKGAPLQIVVVLSGSVTFEKGSDLTPVVVDGDCDCRVYHIRFKLAIGDVYDDLEKLLKRLHPKTFNITSAHELRAALAEIVRDLHTL